MVKEGVNQSTRALIYQIGGGKQGHRRGSDSTLSNKIKPNTVLSRLGGDTCSERKWSKKTKGTWILVETYTVKQSELGCGSGGGIFLGEKGNQCIIESSVGSYFVTKIPVPYSKGNSKHGVGGMGTGAVG